MMNRIRHVRTTAVLAAILCLPTLQLKAATLTNWARAGIATQSTTYQVGVASRAIDGNILGGWSDNSTTHTDESEKESPANPWWQVDLQEAKPIGHVHFWFREDCCFIRNDNLRFVIYDSTNAATRKVLWETNNLNWLGAVPRDLGFDITPPVNGRAVYVEHLPEQLTEKFISLAEVEVFNLPLTKVSNHALQGFATSSSCYVSDCSLYGPQQAIDGNHHGWTSVTGWPFAYSAPDNSAGVDPLPWWQLDLANAESVGSIQIWARHDRTFARLENIRLSVSNAANAVIYQQLFAVRPSGDKFVINFVPPLTGAKTVRIETTDATPDKFLNLPEVEVFAPLPTAPAITFTTNLVAISVPENRNVTFGPVHAEVDGAIRPQDISYRWFRNGVEIPNMAGSWIKSYSIPGRVTPANNGEKYKVLASVSGHGTFSTEVTLTVQADTVAPLVQYADGDQSLRKIRLWFSEPLDPVTAQDPSKYTVSGGVTVTSATLSAPAGTTGDNIVDLAVSALTAGQSYTVTVTGVKDQSAAGNMVPAGSSVQFKAWVLAQGYLTFEHYDNLNGANEPDLIAALNDPRVVAGKPTTLGALAGSLDTRTFFPDDSHENYLSKTYGWIQPTESGNYYFFIASDDASRLYLSTDERIPNPETDGFIAQEPTCCGVYYEPDAGDPATTPTAIPLQAGKRYGILVVHKEGGGGDWMKVAWRKDTDTTPAANLPNIAGQYLWTYVNPNTQMSFSKQPVDQPAIIPSPGIEVYSKDFNSDDAGFTVVNTTDKVPPNPWIWDGANGVWSTEGGTSGCDGPYNSALSSPGFKLAQAGVLSIEFNHRYSFEAGLWDAGQVKISVNGGPFTLVPAENFTQNGYAPGNIVGSGVALGQRAFNGDSAGYGTGQYITSKATLGTFKKDDTVVVQFLAAWDDCSTGTAPNWVIDSMKLRAIPMIIQDFAANNGTYSVENTTPPPPGPWAYNATSGAWIANGGDSSCNGPYNSKLNSPAYLVAQADEVTMSFTHRYSFEGDYWDGGQVRISVNGGPFTPVPASAFSANGYAPGKIQGTGILNGQSGFNGDSPGYATNGFVTSTAILGSFKQNDQIVVQFVGAWDECTTASVPGWVIKNVQLVFGKAAKAVTFESQVIAELRGQAIPVSYQWQRNDGAGFVNIPNATGSSYSFYPVSADFNAQFRVVASVIGASITSNTVKLTEPAAEPPALSISVVGGKVVLTYEGTLRASPDVTGPYQDVQGATSPYQVPNSTGNRFFRAYR